MKNLKKKIPNLIFSVGTANLELFFYKNRNSLIAKYTTEKINDFTYFEIRVSELETWLANVKKENDI